MAEMYLNSVRRGDQEEQVQQPPPLTKDLGADDDRNPLHRAASAGQINLLRKLLEEGKYPIDTKDSLNWTPLIIAASAGHREAVVFLLEKGANATELTTNSQSALHFACGKGHLEIVKVLVEKGCPINTRDRFGYTPFTRAVLANRNDIVAYLLSKGKINLDAKDVGVGNTALHIACEEENLKMIGILFEAGADVKAQNNEKRTPLELISNQKVQRAMKEVFETFALARETGAPPPAFKLPPQVDPTQ